MAFSLNWQYFAIGYLMMLLYIIHPVFPKVTPEIMFKGNTFNTVYKSTQVLNGTGLNQSNEISH